MGNLPSFTQWQCVSQRRKSNRGMGSSSLTASTRETLWLVSSPLHMTRSTRTVSELTGFRLTGGFRGWDTGGLLWPKLSPCCEDCIQGAQSRFFMGDFTVIVGSVG